MKPNWKMIGIGVASAALLFYPALKLYQYLVNRNVKDSADDDKHHVMKAFSPAYRGKSKAHPHHRNTHNGHNGHASPGHS